MSVWLCLPSKRPPSESAPVFARWREMGYKIALQMDAEREFIATYSDQITVVRPYGGYADAVNFLAAYVLKHDPSCDWIVAAGDDTLPDPNKRADEIAQECSQYFDCVDRLKNAHELAGDDEWSWRSRLPEATNAVLHNKYPSDLPKYSTFGVMQPTGDPWSDNHPGEKRLIRRVAGSPWLGREWCERANKGRGPLWPGGLTCLGCRGEGIGCKECDWTGKTKGFYHMFADETLQCVATQLGVFWQREDLTHHHEHWGRPKPGERMGHRANMPAFLEKANSEEEWNRSKAEFERLKADGFKECMPL